MLLNNAGILTKGDKGESFEGLDTWKAVMDVNLFGYVTVLGGNCVANGLPLSMLNVQHTFVPVWPSCPIECRGLCRVDRNCLC